MTLLTWRDAARRLSPKWLRGNLGGKLIFAIAVQADAITDACVAGVKQRFPGLYSDDSLPYLGRDRRIRRGRTETNAVYAARQMRWLDDHRRRGGPHAMLAQLFAHYAPANFVIQLVYRSGRRFTMDVAGAVTKDDAWRLQVADWARWRLFYFNSTLATSDGLWSDPGVWDDGGVWDSTLTIDEATDLRLVPREWNAAHCTGEIVLLNGTVELWDYPAGTWNDPGVWGGVTDFPPTIAIE